MKGAPAPTTPIGGSAPISVGALCARKCPTKFYVISNIARANLKLYVSVSSKVVKKVITNLDLSKASGSDCIPVVVLKNCEPQISSFYILAELFNKYLKESCFPACGKVSKMVPVFKIVGERSAAKNYYLVGLLSVVSNIFGKLVNNRIFDRLEKCGLFSDLQSGFISS